MLIQPLNSKHERKNFDCGNLELNRWFLQIAKQHQEKKISSTYVLVDPTCVTTVFGFYSINPTELANMDLPEKLQKRLPQKVPAFRLGRLAVSEQQKGKRFGEVLLFDAIDRVSRIANEGGGVALVVNAKTSAVAFYSRYGFEPMMDHPDNLFLRL